LGSRGTEAMAVSRPRRRASAGTRRLPFSPRGGWLVAWRGHWFASGWLEAKLTLVIVLSAAHGLFARWVKAVGGKSANKSAAVSIAVMNVCC